MRHPMPAPPDHRPQAVNPRDHFSCPACGVLTVAAQPRCRTCGFTGGDTLEIFGSHAPALITPVFDAAGLWDERDVHRIGRAVEKMDRAYPQFRWCFCAVRAPRDTRLQLLGFWLHNASPLAKGETTDQRQWTIVVIIDAESASAAAVPGYQAERRLDDIALGDALDAMAPLLARKRSAMAVEAFLRKILRTLDLKWKHHAKSRAR